MELSSVLYQEEVSLEDRQKKKDRKHKQGGIGKDTLLEQPSFRGPRQQTGSGVLKRRSNCYAVSKTGVFRGISSCCRFNWQLVFFKKKHISQ